MSKPFANVDGGGEANKETIINKFKNYLMNYRYVFSRNFCIEFHLHV